jgi:predicted GNAT family N-acyltransferase
MSSKKAVITISSGKEIDGETIMAKAYTFTTKHYPVNDLLELDLQDHLEQMAKFGWELVSTQRLINEA